MKYSRITNHNVARKVNKISDQTIKTKLPTKNTNIPTGKINISLDIKQNITSTI